IESLFFFQAEDGIRDSSVTGVQTCALPISADELASLQKILQGSDEAFAKARSLVQLSEDSAALDSIQQKLRALRSSALDAVTQPKAARSEVIVRDYVPQMFAIQEKIGRAHV